MWVRITNGPPPPRWALLKEITRSGLSMSLRVAQANCRVTSCPFLSASSSMASPPSPSSWPLREPPPDLWSPLSPAHCLLQDPDPSHVPPPSGSATFLLLFQAQHALEPLTAHGSSHTSSLPLLNFLDPWLLLRLSPLPGQSSPATQKPLSSFQFPWKTYQFFFPVLPPPQHRVQPL